MLVVFSNTTELLSGNLTASASEQQHNLIVACFVLSGGLKEDRERIAVIQIGWGRSCTYFETIDNSTRGIVADWEEGQGSLVLSWKSYRAWELMYNKYEQNGVHVDFYIKADTDTHLIQPNLHRYLSRFSPQEPHYIGRQFKTSSHVRFVAGAVIIITRESLKRFTDAVLQAKEEAKNACSIKTFIQYGPEDVALAVCFAQIGINPHDTRDEDGAERFMVFDPGYSRDGEWPDWYRDMTFNSARGPRCCSHEAVAFHKISMADMKVPLRFSDGKWDFERGPH